MCVVVEFIERDSAGPEVKITHVGSVLNLNDIDSEVICQRPHSENSRSSFCGVECNYSAQISCLRGIKTIKILYIECEVFF